MISSSFGVGQHMGVIIGGYEQNLGGRRSGWGTGIYVEYGDEVAKRSELKEDLRRNMWLRRQSGRAVWEAGVKWVV